MGAKQKLNSSNMLWVVLIAGLMGAITGSWIVFLLAMIVLLAAAPNSGDIRW